MMRNYSKRFVHIIILIAFIHSLCVPVYAGFEDADTRFEISAANQRLTLRITDNNKILLDSSLSATSPQTIHGPNYQLDRQDDGYELSYFGPDKSILTLLLDFSGDLYFQQIIEPMVDQRKTWGFKTSGHIINHVSALFYGIYTDCDSFINRGILKAYKGEFAQNYYFNNGIIHFGDSNNVLNIDAYLIHLLTLEQIIEPGYQNGEGHDHGVLISHVPVTLDKITYHSYNNADVDTFILKDGASIENHRIMNISKAIRGQGDSIKNFGDLYIGRIDTQHLSLNVWDNHHMVHFSGPSQLEPIQFFNNDGMILSTSSLTVAPRGTVGHIGKIATQGDLEAAIKNAVEVSTLQETYHNAGLFCKSGKVKLTAKRIQHTDHLLNTITRHHLNGRFTHQTETGYVFQKRTTEVKETAEYIEQLFPDEIDNAINLLTERRQFLNTFKNILRENLKRIGKFRGSFKAIMDSLSGALESLGMDPAEVLEILGDEDFQCVVQSLLLNETLGNQQLVQTTAKSELQQFINNATQQIWRTGVGAAHWLRDNLGEVINHTCHAIKFANVMTANSIQYLKIADVACSGRQLMQAVQGPKALPNLTSKAPSTNPSTDKGSNGLLRPNPNKSYSNIQSANTNIDPTRPKLSEQKTLSARPHRTIKCDGIDIEDRSNRYDYYSQSQKLRLRLAHEQQKSEPGSIMAGGGHKNPVEDAPRLVKIYGGRSQDWVKKSSSAIKDANDFHVETHWYENIANGQRVEYKVKIPEY